MVQDAGAAAIRERCIDVLGGAPTVVAIDINGVCRNRPISRRVQQLR